MVGGGKRNVRRRDADDRPVQIPEHLVRGYGGDLGTRLGCLEMMKAGITTFADMWPFPDATAEAIRWAVSKQVNVISISSGGAPTLALRAAVEAAVRRGRGTLHCQRVPIGVEQQQRLKSSRCS